MGERALDFIESIAAEIVAAILLGVGANLYAQHRRRQQRDVTEQLRAAQEELRRLRDGGDHQTELDSIAHHVLQARAGQELLNRSQWWRWPLLIGRAPGALAKIVRVAYYISFILIIASLSFSFTEAGKTGGNVIGDFIIGLMVTVVFAIPTMILFGAVRGLERLHTKRRAGKATP